MLLSSPKFLLSRLAEIRLQPGCKWRCCSRKDQYRIRGLRLPRFIGEPLNSRGYAKVKICRPEGRMESLYTSIARKRFEQVVGQA